jgi:hypothetical protein
MIGRSRFKFGVPRSSGGLLNIIPHMPNPLPYQPAPRVRYESNPDGTLHITIPARGWAGLNVKSSTAAGFFIAFLVVCLLAPLAAIIVAWWFQRTPDLLVGIFMAGTVTFIMAIIVSYALEQRVLEEVTIDVKPDGFLLRRKMRQSVSQQTFPREKIRAIAVTRDPENPEWQLQLHNRYEAETLLSQPDDRDLRQIAQHLRTILNVPEFPQKD